jgi:hypothetical protein
VSLNGTDLPEWNGFAWVDVPGLSGFFNEHSAIDSLFVHDDGSGSRLYAAGGFRSVNGKPASFARWDGSSWEAIGAGSPFFPSRTRFAAFDDGRGDGPVLYISGSYAQNTPERTSLVRWDGASLTPVSPAPQNGSILAFAVFHDPDHAAPSLFAGGTFQNIRGLPSHRFAQLLACTCPADFDHSGKVNSSDFFAFLAAFFSASPNADVNADGAVNSTDFFDFLRFYFQGCP